MSVRNRDRRVVKAVVKPHGTGAYARRHNNAVDHGTENRRDAAHFNFLPQRREDLRNREGIRFEVRCPDTATQVVPRCPYRQSDVRFRERKDNGVHAVVGRQVPSLELRGVERGGLSLTILDDHLGQLVEVGAM